MQTIQSIVKLWRCQTKKIVCNVDTVKFKQQNENILKNIVTGLH